MAKVWNEVLGLGTLERSAETPESGRERYFPMRWTPDAGAPLDLKVITLARGPLRFLEMRARGTPQGKDLDWMSYRLLSGATMAFRKDGPPTPL